MSIVITFEVLAKEGKESELLTFFADTLGDTRKFDGCFGVNLHTEEQSLGTLFMVEEWASKSAYEKYLNWRGERGDMTRLGELIEASPVIRFFNKI